LQVSIGEYDKLGGRGNKKPLQPNDRKGSSEETKKKREKTTEEKVAEQL
jgi:hypothetical protein